MTISQGAKELSTLLSNDCDPLVALVAIYGFLAAHGVGLRWFELGPKAIDDHDANWWIASVFPQMRAAVENSGTIRTLDLLPEAAKALNEIHRTGEARPVDSRVLVVALRALDSAFDGVNPTDVVSSTDSAGLVVLRSKLRLGDPLLDTGEFLVFPKPKRQGASRGQRLEDLTRNLCIVRRVPGFEISYRALETGSVIDSVFRIGAIPLIHSASELDWQPIGDESYLVAEKPSISAELRARFEAALDALAGKDAQIVVLPELVSGTATFAAIRDVLTARIADGRPVPIILAAGSRIVEVTSSKRNSCDVCIDGRPAWVQNKMHAYRFEINSQTKAGLPLGPAPVDRTEAIAIEPRELVFADLSPALRVCVLICEDFIQEVPHKNAVAEMMATLLLIPIMDVKNLPPNWRMDAGVSYGRRPGSAAIVANSGALLPAGTHSREGLAEVILSTYRPTDLAWTPLSVPSDPDPVAYFCEIRGGI